jgi:ABC transporter DrrB family efflux protein
MEPTMTSITTTTSPLEDQAPELVTRRGATFPTATGQTTRRTLLQFWRTPQTIVLPTIMGALFLVLFRYIFGGAITLGNGVEYVDFLVPGFLATAFLWTGMNAPAGIAADATTGVHDRLRSLPIPRSAVVAGRSLADTALATWVLAVTAGLGYAVGFRTNTDALSIVGAFALVLFATYSVSWVFISVGLSAGNAQAAQSFATLLVIPFAFVSSAYVPVRSLPGWMQPIAEHQPVAALINAVRCLLLGGTDAAAIGHSTSYWIVLSMGWFMGILAVFCVIAVARFGRTR